MSFLYVFLDTFKISSFKFVEMNSTIEKTNDIELAESLSFQLICWEL